MEKDCGPHQQPKGVDTMPNDNTKYTGDNTFSWEGEVGNTFSWEGEVGKRLIDFVLNYVSLFGMFFSDYYDRLQNQTKKSGKFANLVNEILKTGKAASGDSLIPVKVSFSVLQNVVSGAGNKHNRIKLKKLIKYLYQFKKDQDGMVEVLGKAAVDIFTSFEDQFVRVTADGSWERAMFKLAHDAVNRVIGYLRENNDEEFSTSLNIKGVLFGKSKRYTHASFGFPHIKTGHSLLGQNSVSWNTASMFEKVGIVTVNEDGNPELYYKKIKCRGSRTSKYGYRRMFEFEDEVSLKPKYQQDNPPERKYTYTLKGDEKTQQQLKSYLLDVIENQSESKMEVLQKVFHDEIMQIKEEARAAFENLEMFIQDNFDELMDCIKENQAEVRELFVEMMEATQQSNEEIKQKLEDIQNLVTTGQGNEKEEERTWFGVRERSHFTGRRKHLDDIATGIAKGVHLITGLSGVGKSELALKYGCDQYENKGYDHVMCIDFSDEEQGRNSFYRLAKEKGIKVKDMYGEDRDIVYIVNDVYRHFSNWKSLFILDNVEKYEAVKGLLPFSMPPGVKKPHILITSECDWNEKWINVQHLGNFTEDEAKEFVKVSISIEKSDNSQDKDISELVRILHRFPLALRQATAYIVEEHENVHNADPQYQYTVADYITDYENKSEELLKYNIQNNDQKTTFTTFLMTLGKIVSNEQCGSKAVEILNIMTFLATNRIPPKMFLNLVGGNKSLLGSVMRLLKAYSIIKDDHDGTKSIHGLMQQVIKIKLQAQEAKEEQVLREALQILKMQLVDRNSAEYYAPHIVSVWNSASKYGELVREFIVENIDAKWRYFPLICRSCDSEIVEAILRKLDDKKIRHKVINRGNDKKTPLCYALQGRKEETAKLLLKEKVNVNVRDGIYNTPLHTAAKYGYVEIVEDLLKTNKIDINAVTSSEYRFTALHFAAQNGHSDVVKELLKRNVDVNVRTAHGFTPLHLAAQNGHLEVADLLLKTVGILVDATTEFMFTPLHLASKEGHLQTVKCLLEKNADIQAVDNGHFTPLHLAAQTGHEKVVLTLLRPTNTNTQTSKGNTPLHLAAESGHLKAVEALLGNNAVTDIKNGENKTALDLAKYNNHLDIAERIENYNKTKLGRDQ